MPQKIDGVVHPKTIDEVLKDDEFSRFFLDALPKGDRKNMFHFLLNPPRKGLQAYNLYIRPGGDHQIKGLPKMIVQDAQAAMQAPRNQDATQWTPIVQQLRLHCVQFMNGKELPTFFKSKLFEDYHKLKLFQRMQMVMGDTKAAAKRLGVVNAYDLEQLMLAITAKDQKKVAAYCRLVIQDNGLRCDAKTLVKALVNRQKLSSADAPADLGKQVNVDARKLQLCGFTNPKDKTLRAAATRMAEALVLADQKMLLAAHKALMKLEPKDSLAGKTDLKGMVKLFKKFKLATD
ncbi:hypothetical protein MHM88_07530 [Epibacterium sp. MM17-32]|uniref:hypothetical protein n=1 Tax=Epibacterium sp. MM17-32 TaxID=2917734 RepID=UPI001EF501E4|nr:hypothetical protein [Epibacterium sp. MM17-32]MCG7627650.1 hypothetical protein [Epibacterium sp. MM17-32]